jgi:hypothetical protein
MILEPRMRHNLKIAADDDSLPVIVPRNDKAAIPISAERVRRLRKHLVVTLRAGSITNRDQTNPSAPGRRWMSFWRTTRSAPGAGFGWLRVPALGGGYWHRRWRAALRGHPVDAAGITGNQVGMPGLGETVLNNHYGAETGTAGGGSTQEDAGAGYDPNLPVSDPAADSAQDFNGHNAS